MSCGAALRPPRPKCILLGWPGTLLEVAGDIISRNSKQPRVSDVVAWIRREVPRREFEENPAVASEATWPSCPSSPDPTEIEDDEFVEGPEDTDDHREASEGEPAFEIDSR
eukprot:176774-Pyramimonas_sp.AAC.1